MRVNWSFISINLSFAQSDDVVQRLAGYLSEDGVLVLQFRRRFEADEELTVSN